MSREWKPGDVAMVCDRGGYEEVAICVKAGEMGGLREVGAHWATATDTLWSSIASARPLVVIDLSEQPASTDPAGRTEAHHLIDMLRETAENFFVPDAAALARKVADQIEEQVGARVTKPAEPMGLGAVVEDAGGDYWVYAGLRALKDGETREWVHAAEKRWYADIAAVRVLSEGVTQ